MSDSKLETLKHISKVRGYITQIVDHLIFRGVTHDFSKLESPEKEWLDDATHLNNLTYNSDEYNINLAKLKVYLDHHYKINSHHPEYYGNGINGMDLVDLVEMLCDWRAATEKHKDGNIYVSLQENRIRFKMSDQLYDILLNTVKRMGW